MKVIVDAHLPQSICSYFEELGCEAFHTSQLQLGNQTSDKEITRIAMAENAIVITKDQDFYHSFMLQRQPKKLIMVKVGNMKLAALRSLFQKHSKKMLELLSTHDLLELHIDKLTAIE